MLQAKNYLINLNRLCKLFQNNKNSHSNFDKFDIFFTIKCSSSCIDLVVTCVSLGASIASVTGGAAGWFELCFTLGEALLALSRVRKRPLQGTAQPSRGT